MSPGFYYDPLFWIVLCVLIIVVTSSVWVDRRRRKQDPAREEREFEERWRSVQEKREKLADEKKN